MDNLLNLLMGLHNALQPAYLMYCAIGVFVGTAVGVLPGLGPTATISLLLPITFRLDPTGSIVMLAGIYYGAMYGGSITAILFRIPGESASIVTALDGHEMAKLGRAGAALSISAIGSFVAGVVATFAIALLGPALANVAYAFSPAEYTSLVLLGLVLVTHLSGDNPKRGLAMVGLGLLIGFVGREPILGVSRFTYGQLQLEDGLNIALVAMGMFGISEVLILAERAFSFGTLQSHPQNVRDMLPSRAEAAASVAPIIRGSVLGFVVGLLPGGGAMLASFASYFMEKKISKSPGTFGKGNVAGLAGPETANNAAAQASFIPLLVLGIPSNVVLGVILGALLLHGLPVGPALLRTEPLLFWTVIASMLLGNFMLIILNIPLLPVFVALLKIPSRILLPLILLFCVVGAFSLNNRVFDVGVMIFFGFAGYLLRKLGFDIAPAVIAVVLGPILEVSLQQSLLIGYGDPFVFFQRPISAVLLLVTILVVVLGLLGKPIKRYFTKRALHT